MVYGNVVKLKKKKNLVNNVLIKLINMSDKLPFRKAVLISLKLLYLEPIFCTGFHDVLWLVIMVILVVPLDINFPN